MGVVFLFGGRLVKKTREMVLGLCAERTLIDGAVGRLFLGL